MITRNRIEILNKLKEQPLIKQRTDEWFKLRENRLTASDLYDAVYHPNTLIKKKLKNVSFNSYAIPALKWGCMFEQVASNIYAHLNSTKINEFGLLVNDKIDNFGASPDGICSAKTLDNKFSDRLGTMLEIKCVAPRGRTIYTSGKIEGHICPYYYYLQVQQQLECCDLDVCDFWQCKLTEYKNREAYLIDNCYYTQHSHGIHGTPMEINSKIKTVLRY